MQAFCHIVIAWLWLQVLLAALESPTANETFVHGKRMAMRYFFAYELPRTATWLELILNGDDTVLAKIGSDTSELQPLLRFSYAVFCLQKKRRRKYTMTKRTR